LLKITITNKTEWKKFTYHTFFVDVDMFYKPVHHFLYIPGMEALHLECKIWGEMSVMGTILGRWEVAVADDA